MADKIATREAYGKALVELGEKIINEISDLIFDTSVLVVIVPGSFFTRNKNILIINIIRIHCIQSAYEGIIIF